MFKQTNPRRAAAMLFGPLMLIAAACGGSASDEPSAADRVASLGEAAAEAPIGTDGAGVDELEAPEDPEDAMALFNECMEGYGFGGMVTVVAGDPGSGGIQIGGSEIEEVDPQAQSGSFEDFDKDAFDEANKACDDHLANIDGGFDLTPEQEAAMADAQLEFADCMAEQGIEMPEVASSSGGFVSTAEIDASEVDPQSGGLSPEDLDFDFEAFDEAAKLCDSVFDQFDELNQ